MSAQTIANGIILALLKIAAGVLALTAILGLRVAASAVPTVVNGSFEDDSWAQFGFYLGCRNTLTGWQTECDGIYPWGIHNHVGWGPTPYGQQWVVVGHQGEGGSGIFQTISGFIPGHAYTLNFALASEERRTVGARARVSFPSGSSTASMIFSAPPSHLWRNWAMYSMPFVATATTVEIRFDGLAGPGFDPGIDNVSISDGTYAHVFRDVNYPGDTFTRLRGINNQGVIAGYHDLIANSGFIVILWDERARPESYTAEKYPGAVQTKVLGITVNNGDVSTGSRTVGSYVDQAGKTHGFLKSAVYRAVDYPGSSFNQLLSQNDHSYAAGYYSMSADNTTPDFPYIYDEYRHKFHVLNVPGAVGGARATGINNSQEVCGFYIDKDGVKRGFYLRSGVFKRLDYPGSVFTEALGLNNVGEVAGVYRDHAGANHGFVFSTTTSKWQSVDDPNGVGTTVVNGINDVHQLVGFWGTSTLSTGFVADP